MSDTLEEPLIKISKTCLEPAKRGDRIKPGVERSGTPGIVGVRGKSPRSGRQPFHRVNRKSWAIARFARSVSAGSLTWGFASLHPRLYAFTRSAGLETEAAITYSEVPSVCR